VRTFLFFGKYFPLSFTHHVWEKPASGGSASKMQRKSICLAVKLQLLRQLEAGEHQVDVGASLNLGMPTTRTIIKNSDKIKAATTT
jgi:hypothetical protein